MRDAAMAWWGLSSHLSLDDFTAQNAAMFKNAVPLLADLLSTQQ